MIDASRLWPGSCWRFALSYTGSAFGGRTHPPVCLQHRGRGKRLADCDRNHSRPRGRKPDQARDLPGFSASGRRPDGRTYRVGFKVLSVLQDGKEASYFQRASGDGVRVYIGEENVFLQPGGYTYTIVYETDRQIRFFDDHDEVYWNATGNEWIFPIDEVVARVILPPGTRAQDWTAYTGSFGERGRDFDARIAEDGREVIFTTTTGPAARTRD